MKTIITDKKLLKEMEKAKHISPVSKQFRPKKGKYYYVDEILGNPSKFSFNGKDYQIEYLDGCFFPFVMGDLN